MQEEIARRKELGALANKSLNTSCFTGKIKCPYCGVSYMHSMRKPRTENGQRLEFWVCGSRKKKGGGHCEVKGSINQGGMKKVLAEVLGIDEFEDGIFLREVEVIYVPKAYMLEIHFTDGRVITKDCPNTGHKDCWTEEYKARASKTRRENGTNAKGSSVLTSKIKCVSCGCNFRRNTQPSTTLEGGHAYYWRCAEHSNGCKTLGMREDTLKPLLAKAVCGGDWDDDVFKIKVDHINAYEGGEMEIVLKDDTIKRAVYAQPKRAKSCSEEQKEHMRQIMLERWTPEFKQEMSERMKQLRKERGDAWRKEK